MNEYETYGSGFGWNNEDFIDGGEPVLEEDDPWGTSAPGKQLTDPHSTASDQVVESPRSVPGRSARGRTASDVRLNVSVSDSGTYTDNVSNLTPIGNGEPNGPADQDMWLLEAGDSEPNFEDDYFDQVEFEEPEPVAEYDSDLGESLYEPTGAVEELARTLKIDEFMAEIGEANSDQKSQCAELLGELSAARLRYWLTWLRRQVWTGTSLLLFIDFRINCWEENAEWWELNVWREWTGHWWTYSNPGTLSLDATYELIHFRMMYPAEQIIDGKWLDDWTEYSPWRLGVSSFAEFVLFRAGLKRGEDWIEILISNSQEESTRTSDEDRYFEHANRSDAEFWFAIQDWHDTADWHDNLGWASGWVDATHPYLPDASWQQYEST